MAFISFFWDNSYHVASVSPINDTAQLFHLDFFALHTTCNSFVSFLFHSRKDLRQNSHLNSVLLINFLCIFPTSMCRLRVIRYSGFQGLSLLSSMFIFHPFIILSKFGQNKVRSCCCFIQGSHFSWTFPVFFAIFQYIFNVLFFLTENFIQFSK